MPNQTRFTFECEHQCACGRICRARALSWSATLQLWVCPQHWPNHSQLSNKSVKTSRASSHADSEQLTELLVGLRDWMERRERYNKMNCHC